jgi:hypothetical protein
MTATDAFLWTATVLMWVFFIIPGVIFTIAFIIMVIREIQGRINIASASSHIASINRVGWPAPDIKPANIHILKPKDPGGMKGRGVRNVLELDGK